MTIVKKRIFYNNFNIFYNFMENFEKITLELTFPKTSLIFHLLKKIAKNIKKASIVTAQMIWKLS